MYPNQNHLRKNGTIEFFRFIYSIVIVFCHAVVLGSSEKYIFSSGAICVEFFFLVSGYLMAQSVEKMPPLKPHSLGKDTLAFMQKKIKALCPNYYIAWIIGFIFYIISNNLLNFTDILKTFLQCIWELLFVTLSGLVYMRINGAVWYISSMLLVMFLIYPFLRKYYEFFTRAAAPLIAVFLLGYMLKTFGHLRSGTQWLSLTYKGNLRALAELCIGISLFPISRKLQNLSLTAFARILLSLAEAFGYIALLFCSALPKATKYDFLCLFFLSLSVLISFSEQSYFFRILNHQFSFRCGTFSFSLYLSHVFYAKHLPLLLPDWNYDKLFVLYWILAVSTGIFVMYSSQFLKRNSSIIFQSLRSLLLK